MNATMRLGLLGVALASHVAQEDSWCQTYPNKPVRVIVPGPPGSAPDVVARVIARRLSELMGQQVFVDNRPGGGGVVSAQIAANSPADGHTVLLTSSGAVSIAPFPARTRPYDPIQDFTPVTLLVVAPLIITSHPSLPVRSVKELISLAKARPNQLIFASTGSGSVQHLTIEMFSRAAGINVVHVPYKGGAPAVIDTMSGEAQLLSTTISPVLPHLQSARLRALAVSGSTRSPAVPAVPTVAESGMPGFQSVTWYAMFTPRHTPAAIVQTLYREVRKATQSTAVNAALDPEGMELDVKGPRALADFHQADIGRWQKIVRDLRASNVILE